jgi:pectinesterase
LVLLVILGFGGIDSYAQKEPSKRIFVDINGQGNFKSIQAAINSLSDSAATTRIIFIKNGIYNEKIFITQHNMILKGEDKEKTIIKQSISRDEWRCGHKDDWGVATLNIDANDISLENLTITNSFGFDLTRKDTIISCKTDTASFQKIVGKDGHQMALRTMKATRFTAVNCRFRSFGGDTVSPWNVDAGMFYFKNCIMEGGVDFYCPRGWSYAENCKFIAHSGPASIWHNGSKDPNSKRY